MNRSKHSIIVTGLLLCAIAPAGLDAGMLRTASPQILNSTAPENAVASMTASASGKSLERNLRHRPKRLKGFKYRKIIRKELRRQGFKFKWGWFFLGAVLGPVGFLISLFDGSDAILSALIGLSVFLAVGLIVLFTVPFITL